MSSSDLRTAAQQALEALEYGQHTLKQIGEYQWESRGQLAMDVLRAALAELDGLQQTHSDECWRWHHECAVAKIKQYGIGEPPCAS